MQFNGGNLHFPQLERLVFRTVSGSLLLFVSCQSVNVGHALNSKSQSVKACTQSSLGTVSYSSRWAPISARLQYLFLRNSNFEEGHVSLRSLLSGWENIISRRACLITVSSGWENIGHASCFWWLHYELAMLGRLHRAWSAQQQRLRRGVRLVQ